MRVITATLLLVSYLVLAPGLFADDLVEKLRAQYENRIFLLRGFYEDSSLHYDQNGELKTSGHSGSWTTGFVGIQKFEIEEHQLQIRGVRVVQVSGKSINVLEIRRTKEKVTITVDLDATNEQSIQNAMASVFVGTQESLTGLVPSYWQAFIRHMEDPSAPTVKRSFSKDQGCDPIANSENPCKVGGAIKPPKILESPDPPYYEPARAAHFEGTCVLWVAIDEAGHPSDVRIQRVLGFGLDDRAVETVRKWKFRPATRDGKPVSVQINVEVNFRTY